MKIVVVGTGYVGLVSGACLADVGIQVVCVDIDQEKVNKLKRGIIPIYEPGLEEIVHRNVDKGRLTFSTSLSETIKGASAVFIAVGTPPGEDGSADLTYVLQVAAEIGASLEDYAAVITKSTVPVGTALKVKSAIALSMTQRGMNIEFDVASNPEFLKEGAAVQDFLKPDRIVIGTDSERARLHLEQLYMPFQLNGHKIVYMDITSAEMTKYAANAMLATRISFMNDIANLCELVGADVNQVRAGIGADPRIGSKFLNAGVGYGGSCFPKDVKALIRTGNAIGHPLRLLEAVEAINDDQKIVLVDKLKRLLGNDLTGKRIAVWGLSFKPQTDDMREAPSIVIIDELVKAGADVLAYDPVAMNEARAYLSRAISYVENEYDALLNADALLLVTEWSEFRVPNWDRLKALMKLPLVLDGRNLYNAKQLESLGIIYESIGVQRIEESKLEEMIYDI